MPRLRKLRRKQKYQYHVNRKRLQKKLTKLPDIKCDVIKQAWDKKKSLNVNLAAMGLVADPNEAKNLKIASGKASLLSMTRPDSDVMDVHEDVEEPTPSKKNVVEALEKQAKDGFAAKKSNPHPIPKEMYRKLTAFLDKYGEDFEAMATDHTNYLQETPAQFRAQVNRLKSIPSQWIPYLRSRGIVNDSELSNPSSS